CVGCWTTPKLSDIVSGMSEEQVNMEVMEDTESIEGTSLTSDDAQGEPADEPASIAPDVDVEVSTQQIIEALLFAADAPLTIPNIVALLGIGSARDVKGHIEALNARYEQDAASFRIEKIAGGYQMLTLPQFNTWLRRFKQSRQDSRLSPA